MRLFTAALIAVLLLAGGPLGGLAGCAGDQRDPDPGRALTGELLDGGRYDPATHAGKVTVVNFWGSWCGPCRDEMPELIAAYEAVRPDGVAFLGVNVRDPNTDLARAFVDRFQVPFPSIRDPGSKLALVFDLPPSNIPSTVILGRDGRPAKEYRRALRRDELIAAIREVVGDG